jgi:hypothetical protein
MVIAPNRVRGLTVRVWTYVASAFRATGWKRVMPALLGRQLTFGLEHGARHVTHVLQDGQGSRRDAVELDGLQDLLKKTLAPIEERLYDEVMVHGVPPDEKGVGHRVSSGYAMDHLPTI